MDKLKFGNRSRNLSNERRLDWPSREIHEEMTRLLHEPVQIKTSDLPDVIKALNMVLCQMPILQHSMEKEGLHLPAEKEYISLISQKYMRLLEGLQYELKMLDQGYRSNALKPNRVGAALNSKKAHVDLPALQTETLAAIDYLSVEIEGISVESATVFVLKVLSNSGYCISDSYLQNWREDQTLRINDFFDIDEPLEYKDEFGVLHPAPDQDSCRLWELSSYFEELLSLAYYRIGSPNDWCLVSSIGNTPSTLLSRLLPPPYDFSLPIDPLRRCIFCSPLAPDDDGEPCFIQRTFHIPGWEQVFELSDNEFEAIAKEVISGVLTPLARRVASAQNRV